MPIIVENHVIVRYEESEETEVFIPEDIIDIGAVFQGRGNLENIHVSEKNLYYASVDGVVYDKQVKRLICCPSGKHEVNVPESVEIIETNAFSESYSGISSETLRAICLNFKIKDRNLKIKIYYDWNKKGNSILEFVKHPDFVHFSEMESIYQVKAAAVCWDLDERIRDFLKGKIIFYAVGELIREQDAVGLAHLLKSGLITKENIDPMIERAIEHAQRTKNTECQLLLIDYKYQQGFFEDSEEIIRKKFEL